MQPVSDARIDALVTRVARLPTVRPLTLLALDLAVTPDAALLTRASDLATTDLPVPPASDSLSEELSSLLLLLLLLLFLGAPALLSLLLPASDCASPSSSRLGPVLARFLLATRSCLSVEGDACTNRKRSAWGLVGWQGRGGRAGTKTQPELPSNPSTRCTKRSWVLGTETRLHP